MAYEITKSRFDSRENTERYFNIDIQNKIYPSCYQYNILVMLAKRLIQQENNVVNACKNRFELDRKFVRKIVNA